VFIKINLTEWAIRCTGCGANVVITGIIAVVKTVVTDWASKSFYELSAQGPMVEFLHRNVRHVTTSEYFDDVSPGELRGGVRCQDVQKLTYSDGAFDVCTSSEVFEHVPDDRRGFTEIYRVLRAGGSMIFSVPIGDFATTRERASLIDGAVIHHLPPEYHDDQIRGSGRVLCYRNYGSDIVDRLMDAGFDQATILAPQGLNPWNYTRRFVVAQKS
jgi:SAM-dependent methyltransferase